MTFKRNYWLEHIGENISLTFGRSGRTILVTGAWRGKLVAEFLFNELNGKLFRDEDVAIFNMDMRRKGIYTFVIDTCEKEFDCKIIPSNLLTSYGKLFWKNRNTHGKKNEKKNSAGETARETPTVIVVGESSRRNVFREGAQGFYHEKQSQR